MDKSIYTAMTGARFALEAMSAVSHNLANASATGFKAAYLHSESFKVDGAGLDTRVKARTAAPDWDRSAGPLQATGNTLDVALHEGVWLNVLDGKGEPAFTRAGELKLTSNGLLTTAGGRTVLGPNGPVSVPPAQSITLGADGTLSIVPEGQTPATLAEVGRLLLSRPDQAQLKRGEDGLFRLPEGQQAQPAAGVALTSGALEGSNVNAVQSLVQMIELQRNYEASVNVIKRAEENTQQSTTLMRLG